MTSTNTTSTAVFHPIVSCLTTGEAFLAESGNPPKKWAPVNEQQKSFLQDFYTPMREESASLPDIKSKASKDADVLNNFLKENNFTIQLGPFQDPASFGVVSILNVLVHWTKEGEKSGIWKDGSDYPSYYKADPETRYAAVHLKDGVELKRSNTHEHPVVVLQTKTGEHVYMTVADKKYEGQDLLNRVKEIKNGISDNLYTHEVVFPMIDLNQEVDISFLLGMKLFTEQGNYFIGQALQQTKFRMNEVGAKAESAVAMEFALECMPPRPHTIDKPFFLWIERDGLSSPLFTGYLAEDSWKEPASL